MNHTCHTSDTLQITLRPIFRDRHCAWALYILGIVSGNAAFLCLAQKAFATRNITYEAKTVMKHTVCHTNGASNV